MKKILIVSTVSRQFYLFEQGNIEVLKSLGYEVHAAANFSDANERLNDLDIIRHHFDIQRSPFSITNIKAYRQLKEIMKSENFDAVHCHSPMGGVLARLGAKAVGIKTIIYTAHGFHFYKGAPLINWLISYPIEKILSKFTNVLITLNKEDYQQALKFKAKKVEYVPGIGVDFVKFSNADVSDISKTREAISIPSDAIVVLSVGELNKRKNHETIIKSIAKLNDPNIYYIICGQGNREYYLKKLVSSLKLCKNIKFLGYRNDMPNIYKIADLFAFPSYREGLPVSLMEAMAAGLPVICSNIRGNRDLIQNNKGGFLLDPNDVDGFSKCLNKLITDKKLRVDMGRFNREYVKRFDKENIKKEMLKIYKNIFF